MTEFQLATVGTALLASVIYSFAFYAKSTQDLDPENFQPKKFIATLLVGAVVGVSMELGGGALAFESFQTELAAMAGTIAIVESLIKAIYRSVKKKTQ